MYGYNQHDWSRMNPVKQQKVIDRHNDFVQRRAILQKKGYVPYKSLKAGSNSTWSYKFNNNAVGLGFNSEYEVIIYLEKLLSLTNVKES